MLFGLPAKNKPLECSVCHRNSNDVSIWCPSPTWLQGAAEAAQDAEAERVRKFAKCEYCVFGVPYV